MGSPTPQSVRQDFPATGSSSLTGLSEEEAARRLRREGYNEIEKPRRRTLTSIAIEICREPMLQLLLAASAIYLILGDLAEAMMLAGSAVITVTAAIVQ